MNLHQKIANVMKTVQYVKKDDHIDFGKTSYKALSEEKLTSVVREQLVANGIVVYPIEQHWQRDGQITHVDVKYQMVDIDNPEDYIIVCSCGDGYDTQDKGAGKAMTYSYKYMILRTFAIPTGEDPDKICSDDIDAEIVEINASDDYCERCGKKIVAYGGRNAKEIAIGAVTHYGRKLCGKCCVEVKNGQ